MSVRYTKCPIALAYDEMNNEMIKLTVKWLEGLRKDVKHTKCPSALAYDEMNIHVISCE